MGRPSRWDKTPEGRAAIAVLNFNAHIPKIPEGGVHYGCDSFTPEKDAAYGWQDPTGTWHAGPERRRDWSCSCDKFVTDGQKRYCERCGRSGLDPMLDFLAGQEAARAERALIQAERDYIDADPAQAIVETRNGQVSVPSRFAYLVVDQPE
jgi:hypothetical protein